MVMETVVGSTILSMMISRTYQPLNSELDIMFDVARAQFLETDVYQEMGP